MTADRLTIHEVATMLSVRPSTFRSYVSRRQAPKPDGTFGRTPFWLRSTIETWAASRPRAER